MFKLENMPEAFYPYSEDLRDRVRKQLRGDRSHPAEKWMYRNQDSDGRPRQGDVFAPLFYSWLSEDGSIERSEGPVAVISSTCDAQPAQGHGVVVAPAFELEELREDLTEAQFDAVRNNTRTELLFMGSDGESFPDLVVDLSRATALDARYFHARLPQAKRLVRLSLEGYLYFLCKLGWHFFRPEAPESSRT